MKYPDVAVIQEKHPLEEPYYWSTFIGAPAIKMRKGAAGTVADWYVFSAGNPSESEEVRNILCHPRKGIGHLVADSCPYYDIAHVMYHMFLLGVANE